MEWWGLLSGLFTGVAWLGTLLRVAVRRRLDFVDWFVGTMAATHGIGYGLVIWATGNGMNPYWERWILPYSTYYWLPPVLSLIAVSGVWLGATWAGAARWSLAAREHAYLGPKVIARVKKLAWGFLFGGILCYWVYTRAYGGFVGLLNYAHLIRSGLFNAIGIENPWSFMQRLGGLAFFASFLFWALILKGGLKGFLRFRNLLGLAISTAFSLYVLYSWRGRVNFVVYLLVFPLAYIYHCGHRGYRVLVRLSIIVLAMFLGLYFLSFSMIPSNSSKSIVEFYASEIAYPTASLFSAIEAGVFRFYQDVVVSPLYALPQRIWSGSFGLESASDVNTERIHGYRKGEGGVTSSIPTDIVTFGYMQMGVAGVAILGILLGVGLVWLERVISTVSERSLRSVFYAYSILMIVTLTTLYADPLHIIHRNIHFIIGIVILFLLLPHTHARRKPAVRSAESEG